MAEYYLNDALKKKAAEKAVLAQEKTGETGEKKLDDVTRVKVLSPGRQVFKRFIRNRLAVFGSVTLIILFLFSFLGPLFYAYGQKEIFYKYDSQNVNYALAKENTAYNGYVVDEEVEVIRTMRTAMNSNIKSMVEKGEESRLVNQDGVSYEIVKLGNEVYALNAVEAATVCVAGDSNVCLGVYDMIKKQMTYADGIEAVEGLEEAAKAIKGSKGEFEVGGATFTFEKGEGKKYNVFQFQNGIVYSGAKMDAGFEAEMQKAADAEASAFEYDGQKYAIVYAKDNYTVTAVGEGKTGMVYTRFTVDGYETGVQFSDEFKGQAICHAYTDGAFEADGNQYTIAPEGEDALVVKDASGNEYAEFSTFTVRRYSGEDSMEYDLKVAVAEAIVEIQEAGKKEGTMTFDLPMQDPETGIYSYDEDGNLLYNSTDIKITQRDTGEYVLNCDQVIYKIDNFASPSKDHLLGTDGDGFDVLARIMYGGRVSLMVGFVVIILETLLGVIMGGLAGYYGGWVDNIVMRLVDIFYCLPSMPIMIILGAMMDAVRMNTYIRLLIMMAALGIMGWAGVARLVRGQILSLREQEFMVAAEATGIKVKDRIFHHLIPNVMPQLIVSATMGIGGVIITESTLSFLGLGVKHPLATWGTIINSVSSASAMAHYAFIWIPVGLLICFTVIAFNFVGDGLRDAYDPKAKR